ncbi:MAG: cellulase family glycosylhydrolase [Myxococcaceae bacterium]
MRRLFAFFLLVMSACPPPTAPPPAKGWSVKDGFIRDPEGRAVVLRGANVSSRHKEPPFFDFHGPADWARMHDEWGFNAVRFLVSWAAIEPQRDQYDDAYLAEVARRVGEASDAGLLVVLDLHQDLYGLGFSGGNGAPAWTCDASRYAAFSPTSPWFLNYLDPQVIACTDGFWSSKDLQAHAVEAWRRLAVATKDVPNLLGVDPLNEPYWGSMPYDVFEEKRLAPFERQVIAAVRESQPRALAFIEPASSRNLGLASKLPALGVENVVYAPHAYDSQAEAGNGFDPSRRAAILENVRLLQGEANALGAALVLGEYGGFANNPGIGEYMDAVYDASGAQAAGALYWHYSKDDGYGLLAADGSDKPALRDAVVRPYPERVSGTPHAFHFDDGVFTFSYLADGLLPSVVSVPPAYRAWVATCDGCEVSATTRGLELTAAAGSEVTLTLRAP